MDNVKRNAGEPGSPGRAEGSDDDKRRQRPQAADPDIQRNPGDYMAGAEGTQQVVQPGPDEPEEPRNDEPAPPPRGRT